MTETLLSFRSAVATLLVFLTLGILSLVDIVDGPDDERQEHIAKTPDLPQAIREVPHFIRAAKLHLEKRYAMKGGFVWVNNNFKRVIFGHSVTKKVNIGKDGFLFLNQEKAIASTQGIGGLDQVQTTKWAAHFDKVDRTFNEVGIPFVFVLAPNKHSVYPEVLPEWVRPAKKGENRADRILSLAIERLSVRPVDAKEIFADHRLNQPNELLYHKTDTHWNELGAALAIRTAFSHLGIEIRVPNNKIQPRRRSGDLARMIGQEHYFAAYAPVLEERDKWNCFDRESITIIDHETRDAILPKQFSCHGSFGYDKKVVAFIDSFGVSAIPSLALNFRNIDFLWSDTVNLELARSMGADMVLQIIVERKMQSISPSEMIEY